MKSANYIWRGYAPWGGGRICVRNWKWSRKCKRPLTWATYVQISRRARTYW